MAEETAKKPDEAKAEDTSKTTDEVVEDTEKKAVATEKKKKNKRSVPTGQVHIFASFNNTIITVTDKNGAVLSASSAGACGFSGSKKGTAYAAQIASEKALSGARQNNGLSRVEVYVKGIGLGRDAAIRALHNVDVMVDSIKDVTTIPHGGVRPRKAKKG